MYYFKNGNFLTVIVVFHFSSSKITFARKKKKYRVLLSNSDYKYKAINNSR